MAERLIERIAAGDLRAVSQLSSLVAAATTDERAPWLNAVARSAAADNPSSLQALLQLIDDHRLDRSAIRRILLDNDQAEDAHQDVLIAVAQSVGRYRGDAAFTTWLHSVARNIAVDHLRKRRPTTTLDDGIDHGTAAMRLSSLISSRSDLADAVRSLPEPFREAVQLRDLEQRTYREIVELTGAEMNTVKSRISRGRALVAAQVADDLFAPAAPPPSGPATAR
ncbi:MAG: sigma-70 family RNA polymerase sigma factor [Actinomycetota bacterium]